MEKRFGARTVTIDIKGLWFALQLLGACALVSVVVYSAFPVVRYARAALADLVGGEAPTAESGAEASAPGGEDWALDSILASSSDVTMPREGAVPERGRFIRIDERTRFLTLYEDGVEVSRFPIVHAPDPDSPDALHQGTYAVERKEEQEVSTVTLVRLPFSVRFADQYAIHGAPTGANGEASDGATGSVELADADAQQVFDFALPGVPIFVQAASETQAASSAAAPSVSEEEKPATSARAYAVVDLESGTLYTSKNETKRYPIASITKLFTAAVASDLLGQSVDVRTQGGEMYTLGDLYYPLFLRSDNSVADSIAAAAGTRTFVAAMNTYVQDVGLKDTSFADPSGISASNVSTTQELVAFARHLYDSKTFLLDISSEDTMTITSASGKAWSMKNQNRLALDPHFRGGKLGYTTAAGQTSLALFTLPFGGKTRTVCVVVLGSRDWKQDTRTLLRWLLKNAEVRN